MNRRLHLVAIATAIATPLRGLVAPRERPARLGVLEYGDAPESARTRTVVELLGRSRRTSTPTTTNWARSRARSGIAKVAKAVLPGVPVVIVGSEDPVRSGLIESFIAKAADLEPALAALRQPQALFVVRLASPCCSPSVSSIWPCKRGCRQCPRTRRSRRRAA